MERGLEKGFWKFSCVGPFKALVFFPPSALYSQDHLLRKRPALWGICKGHLELLGPGKDPPTLITSFLSLDINAG